MKEQIKKQNKNIRRINEYWENIDCSKQIYSMSKNYIKVTNFALSKREIEILRLIAKGATNEEIAKLLFISLSTAKKHIENIFRKLNVKDRTQAAVKALLLKLI